MPATIANDAMWFDAQEDEMSFRKPFRAVPMKLGPRYRAKARRDHLLRVAVPLAVMIGAAGVGGAIGIGSTMTAAVPIAAGSGLSGCRVTDGDTIRCGKERIRLLAIDAPELPGHCRADRRCAPGDPVASADSLRRAMTGTLRINRVSTDRYGRTLALVVGKNGDLSCWQLRQGQAMYRRDWDNGGRVREICPNAING